MKILKQGKHLNIYNIGSNEEIKISYLAKIIAKYFNREININYKEKHMGGTKRRCPDIRKISKLGYKPKIKIKKGIKIVADWYLNNLHLNKKI